MQQKRDARRMNLDLGARRSCTSPGGGACKAGGAAATLRGDMQERRTRPRQEAGPSKRAHWRRGRFVRRRKERPGGRADESGGRHGGVNARSGGHRAPRSRVLAMFPPDCPCLAV